jgi:membrane protease subunit HflC
MLQNKKQNIILAAIFIFVVMIVNASFFNIHQSEQGYAFKFGEPKREYVSPGLHAKYFWEDMIRCDKRLLLHNASDMTLQEKTKKKLLIDYFVLFHIDNPKTYFMKVVTMEKAKHRIDDHVGSDIAATLGQNVFEDIVTNKRQNLLNEVKSSSNKGLKDIDISIKLLSFNRVELPNENRPAVFADMISDRNKIANGFLAEGKSISDSIISVANYRQRQIISLANFQADSIMGKANAEKLNTLNKAYSQSKELFKLYQEIETFKIAYSKNTEWIMSPNQMFPNK